MDTNDDTLHVNDAIEDISNDSIQSFNVPSKGLHELLLLCYISLSLTTTSTGSKETTTPGT